MAALSNLKLYQIRIRIEYAILGIAICAMTSWAAYALAMTGRPGEGLGAYLIGITGLGVLRQLIAAPPQHSIGSIFWFYMKPGFYGTPHTGQGLCIIRETPATRVIFNLDGNVLGDEYFLIGRWHWHKMDADCTYRMPPIALFLTRLLYKPTGMR